MSQLRKIVILGMGGTIAGLGQDQGGSLGYKAGEIPIAQLVEPILAVHVGLGCEFHVEQLAQRDSKDMDIASWQVLAKACRDWLQLDDVIGVVITHGTDTLEETSWFLQCVLQPQKPVVLTCAMRPATALSPDGPANLRDAIVCVSEGRAGVWMTAGGEVHSARWVRKVHPYRVQAFSSESYGPAGWVEEAQVRWAQQELLALDISVQSEGWLRPAQQWPWVELVTSMAAARVEVVDALVAAGVDGLVVAATGNGSVHFSLSEALERAVEQGVVVWYTTRCEQGVIVMRGDDQAKAVCPLSPLKARISLMLYLLCK